MQWFRHNGNLRNAPHMKHIQRKLGDSGYAAAMRLIEVMTERCGSGKSFNPVLTLAPPTSQSWLAEELFPNRGEDANSVEELNAFLNEAQFAGLITLTFVNGKEHFFNRAKDAWEEREVKFPTVQLLNFEEFADVWTARVLDGRTGKNSTKV
jgi:hypothetical protein